MGKVHPWRCAPSRQAGASPPSGGRAEGSRCASRAFRDEVGHDGGTARRAIAVEVPASPSARASRRHPRRRRAPRGYWSDRPPRSARSNSRRRTPRARCSVSPLPVNGTTTARAPLATTSITVLYPPCDTETKARRSSAGKSTRARSTTAADRPRAAAAAARRPGCWVRRARATSGGRTGISAAPRAPSRGARSRRRRLPPTPPLRRRPPPSPIASRFAGRQHEARVMHRRPELVQQRKRLLEPREAGIAMHEDRVEPGLCPAEHLALALRLLLYLQDIAHRADHERPRTRRLDALEQRHQLEPQRRGVRMETSRR